MIDQVVFAALCLVIAAWLTPRWRRMHRHRERNAAYLFFTVNVFGSLALAFALLVQPIRAGFRALHAALATRCLTRLPIHCDRQSIVIRNDNDSPRVVILKDVAMQSVPTTLASEPVSWSVSIEPATRTIAPTESAAFALGQAASGPCGASDVFAFDLTGAPQPTCDRVAFRILSGEPGEDAELDVHATCDLQSGKAR